MSIKTKQVAGVTALVLVIVVILSAIHLATLLRVSLNETRTRAELISQAIFERAKEVLARPITGDPYDILRQDGGVRSILKAVGGYALNVTSVAIVDSRGVAVASSFPEEEGRPPEPHEDLTLLTDKGAIDQLSGVRSNRKYEYRYQMLAGDQQFGEIRVVVSTVLIQDQLQAGIAKVAGTLVFTVLVSTLVAMLLSQWMLRPIHVIQSGLIRLGRGELDVRLDLPEQEFRDLGTSFDAVSAQLSALGRASAAGDSTMRAGAPSDLESVMDNLEDAMALFSPSGELMFRNTAMRPLLPGKIAELAASHPIRQMVERALAGRTSQGPVSMTIPSTAAKPAAADGGASPEAEERLLVSHAIQDPKGRFLGVMLVVRNLAYLSHIQSTLNYSRKLAALGRLMAGVAHEVKNPLNAMTIHLELLKQKLARQPVVAAVGASGTAPGRDGSPDVIKHVNVISNEIRRLDEVVVGFLKFARPDELKLQPVQLAALVGDISTAVTPEAQQRGVSVKSDCPETLPAINADPGMLRQALLNLALNACQAMPNGGTLRLSCHANSRGRVEVDVEDTGVGIPPENLERIFDLYFTTKEKGSGIGLSMVYRIVQLHDGEVEVQSTPGHGTRFRLVFPQA
jgi:signal transduction histidine kinase